MTLPLQIITILVIVFGTMLTRFIPFIIFKQDKPLPKTIEYLGSVLPVAMFGLLVVYALKDIKWQHSNELIPAVIAIILIIIVHIWKRDMLISILIGTVSYMLLIQLI